MSDVIDRIINALTNMESEGRKPSQLLIGNLEAAELERVLHRPVETVIGIVGEVLFTTEEFKPELVTLKQECAIFGVPVKRVDQESLIGVIAEGFE